ncbi:MAG: DsbA family protein [Nitrospirales bacterium]
MNSFQRVGLLLIGFSLGVLFIGGHALAEQPTEGSTESLILKELGEMRKDIQSLRKEVGQLRQEVTANVRPSRPTVTPPPKRIEISKLNTRMLGDSEATVGIVEFTDYQCPFCQRFHVKTFSKLKETYIDSGKVLFIPRDFPLDIHAQASSAAITTRCAGKQGKFWDMREGVFENQTRLGPELYTELATNLALDMEAFSTCQNDPQVLEAVNADQSFGQSIGITGTPGFFVGRVKDGALVDIKRIIGAQPLSQFSRVIDSFLH